MRIMPSPIILMRLGSTAGIRADPLALPVWRAGFGLLGWFGFIRTGAPRSDGRICGRIDNAGGSAILIASYSEARLATKEWVKERTAGVVAR